MLDLYNAQYDRQTLKDHIYEVKLMDILKTQHSSLDTTFIVRYILNPSYQLCVEDEQITIDVVLQHCHHIQKSRLLDELAKYDQDNDSVEDFQSYSEKN